MTALVTIVSIVLCSLLSRVCSSRNREWLNSFESSKERAQMLLTNMTLDEKITLLHGESNSDYTGYVPANDRLAIPALKLNDGPNGFRTDKKCPPLTTTCWPSALTVGSTWDTDLIERWGIALGKEFYEKGSNGKVFT